MSEGESAPLIDIITNFVNKFQSLCEGKSIKKRKNIMSKFILLLCDKAKEYDIWEKNWNEEMFINNMNRLLINKLFHYLWPPMVNLKENTHGEVMENDLICSYLTNQHNSIKPSHLGCEISESSVTVLNESVKFLKKINSVCTPLEKIMYIFGSYKIIEESIRFYCNESVTADNLFPLCIYVTIKANLSNLSSTIYYIENLQMQINDYINYYYSNFMASKDFIETLCYTSFESLISAQEYQQMLLQSIETKKWSIPQTGLVIPQKIAIEQLQMFLIDNLKSKGDEFYLNYFQNIPIDEITMEDVPIILSLLQQMYIEK